MKTAGKVAILAALAGILAGTIVLSRSGRGSAPGRSPDSAPSNASESAPRAGTKPAIQNPVPRRPRLVDLGSTTCIPCRMMAPILEELKRQYAGRLDVEFVDVNDHPAAARDYRIRVIPTQVFLDPAGRELWRHEGFLGKEDILRKWKDLGHDLSAPDRQADRD